MGMFGRCWRGVLLFAMIFGLLPIAPPSAAQNLAALPAPLPDAPKPTLRLSANSARSGERITVTGQGVAPAPGVRLAWLFGASTATAAVVALDRSGAYSASIAVPSSAAPGAAQLCAAVTETPSAAFACVPFDVLPPPPGSVQLQIPPFPAATQGVSTAANTAALNLYDRSGNVVASAPLASGPVSFPQVPPGSYRVAVNGFTPLMLEPAELTVSAGQQASLSMQPIAACTHSTISAVRADPSGAPGPDWDFGTYISTGVFSDPNVVFQVDLQVAAAATAPTLAFYLMPSDGSKPGPFRTEYAPPSGTTYQTSYKIANQKPDLYKLRLEPIGNYSVGGKKCPSREDASRTVRLIDQPLQSAPGYNAAPSAHLKWDGSRYVFSIPQQCAKGAVFPDPPVMLPVIGSVGSGVRPCYSMVGTLDLSGNVRARAFFFDPNLQLFGKDLGGGKNLLPASGDGVLLDGSPAYTTDELRQVSHTFPVQQLVSFQTDVRLLSAPFASFLGIVTVYVNLDARLVGEVSFSGTIRPLAPAVDTTMQASLRPAITVEIVANVLMGVAKVGGGGTAEIAIDARYRNNTDDPRVAWVEDPCLRAKLSIYFFVKVRVPIIGPTLVDEKFGPEELFNETIGGCAGLQALQAAPSITPPRVMAAPHVTSGPDGRMLATYVEDKDPTGAFASPRVMARFWDAQASDWGTAVALTDGAHMVQDPVAAFYGDDGAAMIVWAENTITAAEGATVDLVGYLRKLELFYTLWDGDSWGAPQRLTNDSASDSLPTIGGDSSGISLAWTQDADGDPATRTDWRVLVRDFAPDSGWSTATVLNGATTPSLNAQPSIARRNGIALLAWVNDRDGELTTSEDSGLAIAERQGGVWKKISASGLPTRAFDPSVALSADGSEALLTFLVQGKQADGTYTAIGTNALVWTAQRTGANSWQAQQLSDEAGEAVRGERPLAEISNAGEPLLLFRRFGATGTNAELGQLALVQLAADGTPSAPLYLTDEPRQNWQPALAVNRDTGEALVLRTGRAIQNAAPGLFLADADAAQPALQAVSLSATDDAVESAVLSPEADPALLPALTLSQQHAPVGSTVVVSATVRNLGRALAEGLSVDFFSGTPDSGSLLGSVPLATALAFNESAVVALPIERSGTEQPIYAEVRSNSGGNSSTENDRASARLGALPPPASVLVTKAPGGLEASWSPTAADGVAGYRVLRATSARGSYELVGETTGTRFVDELLPPGQQFWYAVQAYDAAGIVSELSAPAFGGATPTLYLPLVRK